MVYISALLIGFISLLLYNALAETRYQFELSPVTLAGYRANYADGDPGYPPVCSCTSTDVSMAQIATPSVALHGVCGAIAEIYSMCLAERAATNTTSVLEDCGRATYPYLPFYVFRGLNQLCAAANANIQLGLSITMLTHFTTATLMTEASLSNVVSSAFGAGRLNTVQLFAAPLSAIDTVAKFERPWTSWLQGWQNVSSQYYAHSLSSPAAPLTRSSSGMQYIISYYTGKGVLAAGCDCLQDYECQLPFPIITRAGNLTAFWYALHCTFMETLKSFPVAALATDAVQVGTVTVGDLVTSAFVGQFAAAPNFASYFDVCAPKLCTYSRQGHMTPQQLLSVMLGIIGGLSVSLRTGVSTGFNLLYDKALAARRSRKRAQELRRAGDNMEVMNPVCRASEESGDGAAAAANELELVILQGDGLDGDHAMTRGRGVSSEAAAAVRQLMQSDVVVRQHQSEMQRQLEEQMMRQRQQELLLAQHQELYTLLRAQVAAQQQLLQEAREEHAAMRSMVQVLQSQVTTGTDDGHRHADAVTTTRGLSLASEGGAAAAATPAAAPESVHPLAHEAVAPSRDDTEHAATAAAAAPAAGVAAAVAAVSPASVTVAAPVMVADAMAAALPDVGPGTTTLAPV